MEFKYPGVLSTSEGRLKWEMDRWIGVAVAVIYVQTLLQSVVVV